MLLRIHPTNPQPRLIQQVVKVMRQGGVVVAPTDTVYGMACDVENRRGIERIYQLKRANRKKPMSIICPDLSVLSEYVAGLPRSTFRILKRLTPGPYTFILEASSMVPRLMLTRQRTIGIRVPDCEIALSIVRTLGHPYMSTSIKLDDETVPILDPEDIYEQWGRQVDMVIDGGVAMAEFSTVIDLTEGYPKVIREGKGPVDTLF